MTVLRCLALVLALAAMVAPAARAQDPGQSPPVEPAADTAAPPVAGAAQPSVTPKASRLQRFNELTKPVEHDPNVNKVVVGSQILKHANPVTLGRTLKEGYTSRTFLSTHGTVHDNPGDAMIRSMAPEAGAENLRGAFRGSLDAGNLAANLGFPVAQEMVREWVHDGRVNPSEMAHQLDPGAIGGALAGGTLGVVAGAAVQTTLSGLGPVGIVAGFMVKPLLGFVGGAIGAQYGYGAEHRNFSFKNALLAAKASFKPGRDLGSVAGGTIGMVVGQALIPIPGVGAFAGSIVGTLVGGWLGSKLFHESMPNNSTAEQSGVKGLLTKTKAPTDFQPVESLATK